MKDRRKRDPFYTVFLFWCTLLLIFISGFTFSTLRLFFKEGFHQKLVKSAVHVLSAPNPTILVRETVIFPDQTLIFLKYPPSTPLFTKDDIRCVYFSPNSTDPKLKLPPVFIDDEYDNQQIVRCPVQPSGFIVSVYLKSFGYIKSGPTYQFDWLAYEAMIDRDNTTLVFVKGLNLRPGKVSNASRFECLYGWDLTKPKFLLISDVVSIAQEVVRCKTPLTILRGTQKIRNSNNLKVSVRMIGRGILPSIARPEYQIDPALPPRKQHQMCMCTMLRNQARFLREWVMYHTRIGVQHWFIYDNNSDDEIDNIIRSLIKSNFNITRHVWPWIKTQEAGFAHCALRARDSCEWVGFIDVDEFLHLPAGLSLHDVIQNQSRPDDVAELRVSCYSFGPSGLKRVPVKGVMVGYTCRMGAPERHKSILRPEALNSTLINSVHHFHLRDGFKYVNMDRNLMVINHYKYQVWEVFKEKFYRRVAAYVSDWQQELNEGSKDRVPGLGTRAVEPPDWSGRYCEVSDPGLQDRVLRTFTDPKTGMLPWQEVREEETESVLYNPSKNRGVARVLL